MQFSPFGHGAAGIFDELVLFAEAVLVLALLIAFLRSRGKRTPNPQTSSNQEDKQTQSPSETARKT